MNRMGIAIGTTLIAATPGAGVVTWILIVLGIALAHGRRRYRSADRHDADAAARCGVPQPRRPRRRFRGGGRAILQPGRVPDRIAAQHPAGEPAGDALGVAIGAITFSGSVIAFAKLDGRMSGSPIILPFRHLINIALAALIALLIWLFVRAGGDYSWIFWFITNLLLRDRRDADSTDRGADMPVVVSMLNSYSGWAAAALGFTLQNEALLITGALVGHRAPSSATSCARG